MSELEVQADTLTELIDGWREVWKRGRALHAALEPEIRSRIDEAADYERELAELSAATGLFSATTRETILAALDLAREQIANLRFRVASLEGSQEEIAGAFRDVRAAVEAMRGDVESKTLLLASVGAALQALESPPDDATARR